MNHPPVSIDTSDCWTSRKLEGHGILLITAARILLAVRGHELSHSHYVVAEDLLD
jgi:hypothetical protein